MEEQMKRLDKMAAINQLAAGMAHEIRNPLTSLSGSIQMLKSELTLESHQERLMDIILRESERLNALITDFLLFAQPPKTNKEVWNIKSILEETIELFIHSPDYHEGIQIRYPHPLEEIQVLVDPDQMKQVFWNLILNAVQAMGEKGELTRRALREERTECSHAETERVGYDFDLRFRERESLPMRRRRSLNPFIRPKTEEQAWVSRSFTRSLKPTTG